MKVKDPIALGMLLRQARILQNLSLREVADMAGIAIGTLTSIEHGGRVTRWGQTLRDLACALRLTPQAVVDEDFATLRADLHALIGRDEAEQGLRYSVLRRDGYACRYCGHGRAQGALLSVVRQHRNLPPSEDNLITVCEPCRVGAEAYDDRPAPPPPTPGPSEAPSATPQATPAQLPASELALLERAARMAEENELG